MSKSVLKKTLVSLAGIFLLVVCFQATPISISMGQTEKAMAGNKRLDLQPGQWYMVYSDKPITLPYGAKMYGACGFGTAFIHDDLLKDELKQCGGYVGSVIKNSGCIEYRCMECGRKWNRDAEGKLVKCSDKD